MDVITYPCHNPKLLCLIYISKQCLWNVSGIYLQDLPSYLFQMSKNLRSRSIRYRSDAKVLDRCLVDVKVESTVWSVMGRPVPVKYRGHKIGRLIIETLWNMKCTKAAVVWFILISLNLHGFNLTTSETLPDIATRQFCECFSNIFFGLGRKSISQYGNISVPP